MGVIRRDSVPTFSKIKTLKALTSLVACQGMHWPDSDILEAGGISVTRNAIYEGMFKQVSSGRCDYFPRGVHEGVAEVNARKEKYPNLIFYNELIIHYPFPMYFFVTPGKTKLAAHIENGLIAAIGDRSFDDYIRQHPTTAHLFPLTQWINATTFLLKNPQLSNDTPIHNTKLWILPPSYHKHLVGDNK